MQKTNLSIAQITPTTFPLLALAGLAVTDNKNVCYAMLDEGQKKTLGNKTLEMCSFDHVPNVALIQEIHVADSGILVKLQGKLTAEVSQVINLLAASMKEQGLTALFCPGFKKTDAPTWHISADQVIYQMLKDLADAKIYGEQVIFTIKSNPNQLRITPFRIMQTEKDWVVLSSTVTTFEEPIRGLGRISASFKSVPITLETSGQIMTYNFGSKTIQQLGTAKAPRNAIYLGLFRLCDQVDHALELCTNAGQMLFTVPVPAFGSRA